MPEGDSIYVAARKLDVALKGRRLARGELRVAKLVGAELVGVRVLENATHGKHLLTRFDNGQTLHTHLRMDGSWSVVGAGKSLPRQLDPDIRVLLAVERGPTAYGLSVPVVEMIMTSHEHELVGHLGPDPLREDWDQARAVARLAAQPDLTIAAALLDQRLMAGLGNLWVNELCFLRGVSPWTPVSDVDLDPLVRLAARALRHSAKVPGAFRSPPATTGGVRTTGVAGRARQPCRRCRSVVKVVDEVPGDPGQRRTWWCPTCQPGPSPISG